MVAKTYEKLNGVQQTCHLVFHFIANMPTIAH
jgi:hypothetical protein